MAIKTTICIAMGSSAWVGEQCGEMGRKVCWHCPHFPSSYLGEEQAGAALLGRDLNEASRAGSCACGRFVKNNLLSVLIASQQQVQQPGFVV